MGGRIQNYKLLVKKDIAKKYFTFKFACNKNLNGNLFNE